MPLGTEVGSSAVLARLLSSASLTRLRLALLQLDGVPEADAAWFIQQLVCAVEFCHRLGVANRDIKVPPTAAGSWRHAPHVAAAIVVKQHLVGRLAPRSFGDRNSGSKSLDP
jgi:serine/threonine protein kinase